MTRVSAHVGVLIMATTNEFSSMTLMNMIVI